MYLFRKKKKKPINNSARLYVSFIHSVFKTFKSKKNIIPKTFLVHLLLCPLKLKELYFFRPSEFHNYSFLSRLFLIFNRTLIFNQPTRFLQENVFFKKKFVHRR